MAIFNIQNQLSYDLPNATWETFNNTYSINKKQSYKFKTKLPLTNVLSLFSNDRFANSSLIFSSDPNVDDVTNNSIDENLLADLLTMPDNIWKATWRPIKS